jgi:hypothetical protein
MADFTKFLDRNFREIRSGMVSLNDFQEYLQGLGVPVDVREQCKKVGRRDAPPLPRCCTPLHRACIRRHAPSYAPATSHIVS